jgi:hypothetical protein
MSWSVYPGNPTKMHGLPMTGSSRLWDVFLCALADLTDARYERRVAERTGEVEAFHLTNIIKAEKRVAEARAEYEASCPK